MLDTELSKCVNFFFFFSFFSEIFCHCYILFYEFTKAILLVFFFSYCSTFEFDLLNTVFSTKVSSLFYQYWIVCLHLLVKFRMYHYNVKIHNPLIFLLFMSLMILRQENVSFTFPSLPWVIRYFWTNWSTSFFIHLNQHIFLCLILSFSLRYPFNLSSVNTSFW